MGRFLRYNPAGVLVREVENGVEVTTNLGKRLVRDEGIASPLWPVWAKGLKLLAKPKDKGIGDVVARLIGDDKSEAFKAWHLKTFGKSCGCTGRQARWNRQFPLN